MAAYEARSSKALRFSSQWTSYIVFILYLLCTIGETLNVKWTNPNLPGYINSTGVVIKPNSESTVVVALWTAGYHKLAGIINGCLIFSVLSTSNTSLYVASRTLYGMAREMTSQNRVNQGSPRSRICYKVYKSARNGSITFCRNILLAALDTGQ